MPEDKEGAGEETPRVGEMSEAEIDYNVMESFPASDPPAWTLGLSRGKRHREEFERQHPGADEPSHQNEDPHA
jgi:hypothetical protein